MRTYEQDDFEFESALTVGHVMSRAPRGVSSEASVADAKDFMQAYSATHLPVTHQGRLAGVISEQDALVASAIHGSSGLKVRFAMAAQPYIVPIDDPLEEVLAALIERKATSALVMGGDGRVAGMFTVRDALRMLRALVRLGASGPEGDGPGRSKASDAA